MFASYLPPFPYRHQPAPYLFVFYKQLGAGLARDTVFLGPREYFADPAELGASGRWEFEPQHQLALGYTIPSAGQVAATPHRLLDRSVCNGLAAPGESALAAFRRQLTEVIPGLRDHLAAHLRSLHAQHPLEGVLTWVNCPSLSAAAAEVGIPVLHHELGALRAPLWPATGYLDFSGVNGNTEAASRFARFSLEVEASGRPLLSRSELLSLLFRGQLPDLASQPAFARGIAFQVEDDSNLVAYGRGWDAFSLWHEARRDVPPDRVLVRAHPGGHFQPRAGTPVSSGETSASFIARCSEIWTINSSLGLEAALLGRPVRFFGDCPFSLVGTDALAAIHAADRQRHLDLALNFLVLAYLVPFERLFDAAYTRWRLGRPSELAIVDAHLPLLTAAAPSRPHAPPPAPPPTEPPPPGDTPSTPATYLARLEAANRDLHARTAALESWARELQAGNETLASGTRDLQASTDYWQGEARRLSAELQAARDETTRLTQAAQSEITSLQARVTRLTTALQRARPGPTA